MGALNGTPGLMGLSAPAAPVQPGVPSGAPPQPGAPVQPVPSGAPPQPGAPETQNIGFTGTVEFQGEQIKVDKGVAVFKGKKFFVTDEAHGNQVIDSQGMVVAQVQDGKVVEAKQ